VENNPDRGFCFVMNFDAHTLLITALLVPSRNPIFRFAQSV